MTQPLGVFGSWYSLGKRSGKQYLLERVKRLLVPLYTVGLFVLLLPQSYFYVLSWDRSIGTFWQWIPRYLSQLLSFQIDLADPEGLFMIPFPGHLWFLGPLCLVSLIALPLLLVFRS